MEGAGEGGGGGGGLGLSVKQGHSHVTDGGAPSQLLSLLSCSVPVMPHLNFQHRYVPLRQTHRCNHYLPAAEVP